jgi:MiaB-like tRNA modifying enzyme
MGTLCFRRGLCPESYKKTFAVNPFMRSKTFYLESYGCSMNAADSERIAWFLESRGLKQVSRPEKAVFLLLNSCAVKEPTEAKMLRRALSLGKIAEKNGARLVVCGCLPKINPSALQPVSGNVVQAGVSLEEVAVALNVAPPTGDAEIKEKPSNPFVSIIPIARGCLGKCSYCAVKSARGCLRSYSEGHVTERFGGAVRQPREVWLTAQDTGCYGLDIGSDLPSLLKRMLKSRKRFRIRIGMMNPEHLLLFYDDFIGLFEDERLYQFFHIPIQSGSNRILSAMNRNYSAGQAKRLCRRIRADLPLASIATDIIVGFPGETNSDFRRTVELVEAVQPDVLNISRFGARPNTPAASMNGQLHGRVKKERSRLLSALHKRIALKRNRLFLGREEEIFVSERSPKKNFVGRNSSYKAVVVEKDRRGSFAHALIEGAFPTHLKGKLLHGPKAK